MELHWFYPTEALIVAVILAILPYLLDSRTRQTYHAARERSTDAMTTPSAPGLDVGTRLAVDRTALAHERTLMAWIRTAASLISFGFTIYKFFDFELKGQTTASRA